MTDHEGMHPSPFQAFGPQANAPAAALSQHPDVIIAIYVGLCALVIWAAYQVRNRCHSCGSVPPAATAPNS